MLARQAAFTAPIRWRAKSNGRPKKATIEESMMSRNMTSTDPARRQEAEFHVNGMTCEGCVSAVRRSLESLPGVGVASIDLETGRASVEFDGSRVREQDLIAAVRAAGYGVDSNATLNVSADSPGSGRSASHSGAGAASATLDTPTAIVGPSSQARPGLVTLSPSPTVPPSTVPGGSICFVCRYWARMGSIVSCSPCRDKAPGIVMTASSGVTTATSSTP